MKTPDLFDYNNFRAFLKAYAQDRKRDSASWSYGVWARKLGLKGTASLTMVINGQRDPGPKMVESLIEYFEFRPRQAQFFKTLVKLGKLKSSATEKAQIWGHLKKEGEPKILDLATFSAVSEWYYYVIYQLSEMPGQVWDEDWIQSQLRFPVDKRYLTAALKNLEQLKIIERTPDNKIKKIEQAIDTTNDVASEAIKRYHEQTLDLAQKSIRTVPIDLREFSSLTIAVNSEALMQAKELIRQFKREFDEIMSLHREKDAVYQLQIQLFPLTDYDAPESGGKGT